jgi:uncharacterized protein YraI
MMKVRIHKIITILISILLGLLGHNAWASSDQTHCIIIGDSQTSSSLNGGFARTTINQLEERGVRVTSYSISSSSARHWHNPAYNPLREDILTGRMRVSPDEAVIPNLDAHSSQSLFQQIIEHHRNSEHPADCIIFQLGDNAPRTGEIAQLTQQWQQFQEQPSQCYFVSPTWPEERHPNNQYRFKTRQRTIEIRTEIENELLQNPESCQHISTTGTAQAEDQTLLTQLQSLNSPYTSDGLHLNIRGGQLWGQAVVEGIDRIMNSPSPEPVAPVGPPAQSEAEVRVPEQIPRVPQVETTPEPREPPPVGGASLVLDTEPAAQEEEVASPAVAPVEEVIASPEPEENQYQVFELVCNSNLNMRLNQSAQSRLLGKIPCRNSQNQRERVAILNHDEETGWFQVVYDGQVAWVSGNYLRPTEEYTSIPQITEETPTPGVLNCRSNLNMRLGPSTAYLIQGRIPCATDGSPTSIEVLGVEPQSGWLYINHNGTNAFVHPRYVTTDDEITNQITDIVSNLQCQHTTAGCPQQVGRPPQREDCEGCDDEIVITEGWLPGCEILQRRNFRDSDQRHLQTCFSSIQNAVMAGNPSRGNAFRRMYQRLNEAEQRFLAHTLTAMGEIPPNFAMEEMQIVMKVIDNRLDYARARSRSRNANALDVALQPWQFSMYNADINLWRTNLQSGPNSRHRANAIRAYMGYQEARFTPPEQVDRVYHYHANYVSPNWRNNNRIVRPLVNGTGLRQSGTRHIFYRDIAWSFRHNDWSGK